MTGGTIWLIAGLLLGALELILPGYFLLWIGLSATGAGLLTVAFGFSWHWQFATFSILAVALVGIATMRRRPVPDTVNAPNAGLIGATCYALGFDASEGRVRLRDGTWQARLIDGIAPQVNEPMRIVGLDGTTLLVARRDVP